MLSPQSGDIGTVSTLRCHQFLSELNMLNVIIIIALLLYTRFILDISFHYLSKLLISSPGRFILSTNSTRYM
ncbi:hypothetical protein BO79DRAFT_78980 [Aspergillus costaricaensis CBS 115574]|uniref:Uncharacterized protein n=1 Tax=Aspergillus costaricaensis CBS 115574 TaxID=1448317 RepID=A0ACD1IL56_9EURO|nr:hypothetical protein BO79DRAFT_78980 [Aspergillus costaricaensis CBS 115574]RAK91087.1 hypothetical protein BO79DRAFT_78980 [Aspergillus costaricaensis CBS 115574]